MSANIWGKHTFGRNDSGNPMPSDQNIYTDYDLHISTAKNKIIYINDNKSNTSYDNGNVIINYNTTNANVEVANGDVNIDNGDLNCLNLHATNNINIGNNFYTPCLNTSTTDFQSTTGVTNYTTTNINRIDNINTQNYTNGLNAAGSPALKYTASTSASAIPYTVQFVNPANQQNQLIINVPVTYVNAWNTPYATRVSNSCICQSYASPVTTSSNYATVPNNQWINLSSQSQGYLQKETSPGSGTYATFNTKLYWQRVAPETIAMEQFTLDWTNNSNISPFQENPSPAPTATLTGSEYFTCTYQFRCVLPSSSTDTNYRLLFGIYTLSQAANINNYQGSFGPSGVNFHSNYYINLNNTTVSYSTYTLNFIPPVNTTIGTTMINNLMINNVLPKFNTGWIPITVFQWYTITHNLNMILPFPFRLQILWSQLGDGSYPIVDITGQQYGRGNNDICGAWTSSMQDANTLVITAGAYSVCNTTALTGSGTGNTSNYVNKTNGFWYISIF